LFISPCRRQRLKAYLVKKAYLVVRISYLVSARATWHLASRPCLRDTRNEMRDTHLIFLRDTRYESHGEVFMTETVNPNLIHILLVDDDPGDVRLTWRRSEEANCTRL